MSTGIEIKKKLAILNESASVTTDASSIDFVGSGVNASTVGNNVTVTIPGGSGNTTYYMNATIPETPYAQFSSVATTAVEQVLPWTVDPGLTEVAFVFQTPSGVPNTTQIPGGLWQFFLHFSALSINENWIIRPTVYKRDLGGTETLLFTADPQIINNLPTVTTMYVCDGVFPATTLLTTDRLVVKIALQNTGVSTQTLNFRTEGSQHYSVAFTTLNQVIAGGSVTSVTGTAPIVSSGGTTPAISIPQATGSANGYLSSSDWSVFNAKVPATRNITINGTTQDLSADRTWTVSAATGIWGIANASGVYTYYATWALAVAAATSGQVIELFADITETTVSYILKSGVNIQGNGHTITFNNSLIGFYDNDVACTVVFSNINLIKTQNLAVPVIQCFNDSSNIGGYNTIINVANASGSGFYGSGTVWGFTFIGQSNYIITRYYRVLIINNCSFNGTGSLSLNDITTLNNCYMKSTGTVNSGNIYNSIIISTSNTAYYVDVFSTKIVNSTLISMTSYAIASGGGGGLIDNCYIYSAGARPLTNSAFTQYHNSYIESATSYINQYGNNCGSFYNCTLKAKLQPLFNLGEPKLYNCNLINEWNNVAGRVTEECTNVVMINNYISLANSSAFVNYATTAKNIYMYGNAIKGTSNINSASITNLQTNTADAQGNVILQ
jgi:hypothetical protein